MTDDDFLSKWPRAAIRAAVESTAGRSSGLTALGEVLVHEEPKPPAPILAPGAHTDIPMDVYLQQKALSASVLCELDQKCPYAAWFSSWLNPAPVADNTDASDTGEVAHQLLLEGCMDAMIEVDPRDYPGLRGGIPDGWTNKAIQTRRDEIRASGKIPVLADKAARIRMMVESALRKIAAIKVAEPAIWRMFQPGGGDSELSCLWLDEGDTLCRIRCDRINKERDLIVDVKSTKRSAEPDGWARAMFNSMGLRLRGAWYGSRGAPAVFGQKAAYIMLVWEQNPPHLCSLVGLDPTNLAMGVARMQGAFGMWQQCMADGYWPGYPERVAYPEARPWEIAEAESASGDLPVGYNFQKEGFPL